MLLPKAFFRKYGSDKVISDLETKGIDLSKSAELMAAYKPGDNFSTFRAHGFIREPVIRDRFRLNEFDVKALYRAAEISGQNRERISDAIFDRTSPVYFGYRPQHFNRLNTSVLRVFGVDPEAI